MESAQLLSISMVVYLVSTIAYLGYLIFKMRSAALIGMLLALSGVTIQTLAILLRWYESYQMGIGRAPLTNMYESLVFFAWCIVLFYLFLELRFKVKVLGAFVMPSATLCIAYASFSDKISDKINPLVPALQSDWLIAHVVTCFVGYGAFTVAASLGVMYLLQYFLTSDDGKKNALTAVFPDSKLLDDLIYRSIVFGFIWLSAGIITGAIWANEAWGTYWSWDPKETWSIITWFFYASTLHARFTKGWRGFRIAVMAIIGFFIMLFTYFGVNFFLSGLHSYGSS